MELPVPSAFHLELDTSPADWIVSRLKPWGKDRVRLWSWLPDAFDAYARVLHPAYRLAENVGTVRWRELAERNGVTLGPATGFREVSRLDPADYHAWDTASPNDGTLEREQVVALTELLMPHTRTPGRCWLAAWEGWGSWGPGESQRQLASIPRVSTEHRAYFLFTSQLGDIGSFEVGGWYQTPNIWWPDDRSWCVATEIDGYSTYVGGSAGCIATLLASQIIEAIAVPLDVPMDPGPYRLPEG